MRGGQSLPSQFAYRVPEDAKGRFEGLVTIPASSVAEAASLTSQVAELDVFGGCFVRSFSLRHPDRVFLPYPESLFFYVAFQFSLCRFDFNKRRRIPEGTSFS
jgi:hypothetical protein